MKDDGGPAFPFPSDANAGEPGELGMTLRDYFAAAAMQGLCAAGNRKAQGIVEAAYIIADGMLKVRKQ